VTPDGNRLYYASDETGGNGGADIYYVDKNEDGSWKPTSNAGQAINTAGNELFPTFYEGNLYFSSNGHPGLGGLDIYKATIDARGDLVAKNVGYPVNSNKDDLGYSIIGKTGFFSSNRKGSDDIYAFDYAPAYIKLEGKVAVDSVNAPGKKVYITSTNDNGRVIVVDSAVVDNNGSYTLKARPNKEYTLITFDADGQRFDTDITTDGYAKNNDKVIKQVNLINIPLTETEKVQKKAQQDALWASQHKYGLNARTVDSLMQLSKDYVELHHPFNQERIIEKDLKEYNNLISRIRTMRGKEIVIVSATDCNGTEQYNEGLSQRRAKRIYNKINGLSSNKVVIKNVGERELLKACDDVQKSIEEQVINRYSFVFIIDKK
jgi:outer membrane protein OmpA-like peptidoglycan-associated protein